MPRDYDTREGMLSGEDPMERSLSLLYGVLMFGLGIAGWVLTGSLIGGIAGFLVGVVLVVAAYALRQRARRNAKPRRPPPDLL